MFKPLPTLIVVCALTLATANCAPPGQLPSPLKPDTLGGFGTAQVDGVFDAHDQWQNARCMGSMAPSPKTRVEVRTCAMNDASNLYVLITYWGQPYSAGVNDAGLSLDKTSNGTIDPDDDLWIYYQTPNPQTVDSYWLTQLDSQIDDAAGGTTDGAGAFGVTPKQVIYELRHPLKTGDARDVALVAPDTIGALIYLMIASMDTMFGQPHLIPIVITPQPTVPPVGDGGFVWTGKPPLAECYNYYHCHLPVLMVPRSITLQCSSYPCRVINQLDKSCLIALDCPRCPPGELCAELPWRITFNGLADAWDVDLVNGKGKTVPHKLEHTTSGIAVSFTPPKADIRVSRIPDYAFVFTLKEASAVRRTFQVQVDLVGTTPRADGRVR